MNTWHWGSGFGCLTTVFWFLQCTPSSETRMKDCKTWPCPPELPCSAIHPAVNLYGVSLLSSGASPGKHMVNTLQYFLASSEDCLSWKWPQRNHLFWIILRMKRWIKGVQCNVKIAFGYEDQSLALRVRFIQYLPVPISAMWHSHQCISKAELFSLALGCAGWWEPRSIGCQEHWGSVLQLISCLGNVLRWKVSPYKTIWLTACHFDFSPIVLLLFTPACVRTLTVQVPVLFPALGPSHHVITEKRSHHIWSSHPRHQPSSRGLLHQA